MCGKSGSRFSEKDMRQQNLEHVPEKRKPVLPADRPRSNHLDAVALRQFNVGNKPAGQPPYGPWYWNEQEGSKADHQRPPQITPTAARKDKRARRAFHVATHPPRTRRGDPSPADDAQEGQRIEQGPSD